MTSIQPDVPDNEDEDKRSIERDEPAQQPEDSRREGGTTEREGVRSTPVIINR